MTNKIKSVLTVAGSDSGGGAGIQADTKTITALGEYASNVITAVTVQNTLGVSESITLSHELVSAQIDAVCGDIFPDAVKIGIICSRENIVALAEKIKYYGLSKIVLDPVMVSTSGKMLMESEAMETMVEMLMPLVDLITPNIPEAEKICGIVIKSDADRVSAAKKIGELTGTSVLIKGGHEFSCSRDLLLINNKKIQDKQIYWFSSRKLETKNTHGTGCTLSSAIATFLAKGYGILEAVQYGKYFLYNAMKNEINLGHGNGPLNHMWDNPWLMENYEKSYIASARAEISVSCLEE